MTVLSAAILLFLVMDPLGNILSFVTALSNVPVSRRRRVVVRERLIAYAVLVLFLIALRMVFPSADSPMTENITGEPFLVPLAIPSVAGPSTLATLAGMVAGAHRSLARERGDPGARRAHRGFPGAARPGRTRAAHGSAPGGARGANVDRGAAGRATTLVSFTIQCRLEMPLLIRICYRYVAGL